MALAHLPDENWGPSPDVRDHGRVVERGFAWLHVFKRLRTRYEHRVDIHLGLLQLAC